jgi:hypothetical protein
MCSSVLIPGEEDDGDHTELLDTEVQRGEDPTYGIYNDAATAAPAMRACAKSGVKGREWMLGFVLSVVGVLIRRVEGVDA